MFFDFVLYKHESLSTYGCISVLVWTATSLAH